MGKNQCRSELDLFILRSASTRCCKQRSIYIVVVTAVCALLPSSLIIVESLKLRARKVAKDSELFHY